MCYVDGKSPATARLDPVKNNVFLLLPIILLADREGVNFQRLKEKRSEGKLPDGMSYENFKIFAQSLSSPHTNNLLWRPLPVLLDSGEAVNDGPEDHGLGLLKKMPRRKPDTQCTVYSTGSDR